MEGEWEGDVALVKGLSESISTGLQLPTLACHPLVPSGCRISWTLACHPLVPSGSRISRNSTPLWKVTPSKRQTFNRMHWRERMPEGRRGWERGGWKRYEGGRGEMWGNRVREGGVA